MSELVTPAAARLHLRGADELADEDLEQLISTAEADVADFLGRNELIGETGWLTSGEVPANVVHAIKLSLTGLYENRAEPPDISATLRRLVGRYIVLSIG